MDGVEVIHGLRGWTQVPIIILSARDRQGDKVHAVDAGADDYVTKPFGMDELLARVRASLRRAHPGRGIMPHPNRRPPAWRRAFCPARLPKPPVAARGPPP
jgi:two-component system KDP operon response regulator KdpE